MVLEKGRVAQFGTPLELMEVRGGIFERMCEDSGEKGELLEMARVASARKRS